MMWLEGKRWTVLLSLCWMLCFPSSHSLDIFQGVSQKTLSFYMCIIYILRGFYSGRLLYDFFQNLFMLVILFHISPSILSYHLHPHPQFNPYCSIAPLNTIVLHLPFLESASPWLLPVFSDLYGYSKWNIHYWRFKTNIHKWENTYDICLSGSRLPDSEWLFPVPSIYLGIT